MPRAKKKLIKKIIEEVTDPTYEDQSHPLEILELVCSMAETLTEEQDKSAWAFTSRFFRDSIQTPHISSKLFWYITRGNEDKIHQLFDISPPHLRYLAHPITEMLTDPAGRKFIGISAFQYAVWGGDWHMWMKMLDSLQEAYDAGFEEAQTIQNELLAQYNEVLNRGIDYLLPNGVRVKGETHFDLKGLEIEWKPNETDFVPHKNKIYVEIKDGELHYQVIALSGGVVYDRINLAHVEEFEHLGLIENLGDLIHFKSIDNLRLMQKYLPDILRITAFRGHTHKQALLSALQTYVDLLIHRDSAKRKEHWCRDVGGAQQDVTAHVANEYCRDDLSFYPVPDFHTPNLPRTLQFYSYMSKLLESWWGDLSNLGSKFAVLGALPPGMGSDLRGRASDGPLYVKVTGVDAISALSAARIQDRLELRVLLEKPLQKRLGSEMEGLGSGAP